MTFNTTNKADAARLRRLLAPAFTDTTLQSLDDSLLDMSDKCRQILLKSADRADSWSDPADVGSLSETVLYSYLGSQLTTPGFYFMLDVVMAAVFAQNLNLTGCSEARWLPSALLDGNHYMYLRFAWPSLFMSRLFKQSLLRDWMFPKMALESQKFEDIAARFIRELKDRSTEHGFYTALCTASDLKTGESFSEVEIWRELKMLTRAGKMPAVLLSWR